MFAQIILSTAHAEIDRIFDYEIPFALLDKVCLGIRVKVPFGAKNSSTEGYVVGIVEHSQVPPNKVKCVVDVMDKFPVFSSNTIKLAWWMREKYYTTLTQCLQAIIPAGINLKNEEKLLCLNKYGDELKKIKEKMKLQEKSALQLLVIEFVELYGANTASKIQHTLKISPSPIKTLLKNDILKEKIQQKRKTLEYVEIKSSAAFKFTDEQQKAYDEIMTCDSRPVLIHGITGSGKTEIYLQAIEEIISKGKQAIVLVPEISLTPQLSNRFLSRFGEKVGVTHSRMSDGERHEVWQRAKNNEISIVIGPRSAVFAPLENLGIIIIDEEHDGSYKSDTTPKYDAREVAEYRCNQQNAVVVYGTATPSMKTYYRAQCGEVRLVKLKKRPLEQPMPKTEIVDMRNELAEGNRTIFSRSLYEKINEALKNKQQIILFINRRGFSTFVSCRKCGEVIMCDRCNVSYTYHAAEKKLMCHYCGSKKEVPQICPKCGSKYIKYFGTGTQKVEEEVRKIFPQARVLRMDMDTTKKSHSHSDILSAFGKGKADILIGTQMIAKGHDFPNVTLVGVIAADISLNMGDYKSGENTFQLITQVSGRAGRDKLPGRVVIQTYSPENYIIQLAAKGDYEEFYKQEAEMRKLMLYPPYSNLFSILAFGKNEKDVMEQIDNLKNIMYAKNSGLEILGPTPAIISKIKDEYRWQILVKGEYEDELRNFVVSCVDELRRDHRKSGVLINISLNPQSIV